MSELLIDSDERKAQAIGLIEKLSPDKRWLFKIERYIEHRTHEQNARLWLLHTRASEATGYAPEEMHELALCRFFGFKDVELGGIKRQIPLQRSSTRNKKEFAEFMTATEAWYISELGVWLE